MKYFLTSLIMIWACSINAQNHLNQIDLLLAKYALSLKSDLTQELKTGDGKISGQLFDQDSNELISDDINFNVSLLKRHLRFGQWLFIESIESENAAFEFNGLESGQYVVYVSYGSFIDLNLSATENNVYVSAAWSTSGNHTCINCDLSSDRIITLDSNQTEVQTDFELEKGGLLVVSLANNQFEYNPYFHVSAINENDQFFNNSIPYTYISGSGLSDPITTTIKSVSILPSGKYRISSQTTEFIDEIYGGETCEYCEFDLQLGSGSELSVVQHQTTEVEMYLNKPNSTVSGRIHVSEPSDRARVRLINFNYRNQYSKSLDQTPYEFGLNAIKSGIYFLTNYSSFSGENFNYYSFYGDTFCGGINCDVLEATPILIGENQSTTLQPSSLPLGGIISGEVFDFNGENLLDDPYLRYGQSAQYVEFYDQNKRYMGAQLTNSYLNSVSSNSFQRTLPAGKYYVKTGSSHNGESNRNYVDQIYPGINCAGFYCDFSQAELVTIEVGETMSGINFNLETGFGISGKVINSYTGNELKDINLLVHDESFNLLGATKSDDSGDYGFFNLPSGHYYVSTANGTQSFKAEYIYSSQSGYQDQLYPNISCPNGRCNLSQGQKITVQDNDVSAINFMLSQDNALSGTVTDTKTDQPIEHLNVGLYQADGSHIADYKTNHLGFYATGALLAGDYLIKTQAHNLYPEFVLGYGTCLYGNCVVNDGTAFNFNGSQAVDFQLSHKKDLYATFSGNWYQPDESGHGFQFEVISQNDASHLYVTWFAHLDGKPIWLTGTGLLLGDKAYVDLYITDGQNFPSDMNIEYWGALRVNFSDLNHATANWQPVLPEFTDGQLELERLTVLSSEFSTNESIGACFSGSYYDPARNGEGMVIEALGDPTDRLVMTWYSYRGDEQFWMIGTGSLTDDQATFTTRYSQGSSFSPDFNPNDIENIVWGEVIIKKIDNNNISVNFNPNETNSDFETKQTQLTKLTEIHTLSCQNL